METSLHGRTPRVVGRACAALPPRGRLVALQGVCGPAAAWAQVALRVLPRWRSPALSVFVLHRIGHQQIGRVGAMLRLLAERPEVVPGYRPERAAPRRARGR